HLRLLIIGGGYIGYEKLNAVLLNSPATHITLVASKVSTAVNELAGSSQHVTLHERPYTIADLDQADIVIIAINDKASSYSIYQEARKKGKLVNVADTPDLCDFYLGAIVSKGNLKIGISTNGMSPTIAKRIKEVLNETLPDQINVVLDNMQVIRNRLKGDFQEKVRKLNDLTRILVEKNEE
ncbi:MAG: bifunctional precorrin-2 dehydrogenase/sirohydrochlorin ferrochelatase, partial [Bacteroidota bacterium]|nr:bifunctional precorrin-2 dehydrogenase/sirohydrochlorin ferrochelatase [Bacteroidota bacterium]